MFFGGFIFPSYKSAKQKIFVAFVAVHHIHDDD